MSTEDMQARLHLLTLVNELFLKGKKVEFFEPEVVAAISSIASNMVLTVDDFENLGLTKEEIVLLISNLYESDYEEIKRLSSGMGPQYAVMHTGFATDYMDASSARNTYEKEKEKYDDFYKSLSFFKKIIDYKKETGRKM